MKVPIHRRVTTVLALALVLASSVPSQAFASVETALVGRTQRAIVHATPPAERVARSLLDGIEADRDAIARDLGRDYDGITEVRIAHDPQSFTALLPDGVTLPHWAQGVAFPSHNLVVIRAGEQSVLSTTRGTLRHELSHVAIGRLAGPGVPRWFLEGLATVHSGDAWSRKGPSLVRAALSDGLFSFDALSRGFPARTSDAELAYAQSADFVSFLIERGGEDRLGELLRLLVEGRTFDDAVLLTFGERPRALENEWRRGLARWELLARFLTSTDLWWAAITFMAVFAWLTLRRRKQDRLEEMEHEELEEERLLAEERLLQAARLRAEREAAGMWLDDTDGEDPGGHEDDEEDDLLASFESIGREEGEEASGESLESTGEWPGKKPTIH